MRLPTNPFHPWDVAGIRDIEEKLYQLNNVNQRKSPYFPYCL